MTIKILPDYIINRLKAGEIVQRPASIIKELIENSLDAGAKNIIVSLNDGGKSLINIQDDGEGIQLSDMELVLERYATSKIFSDDLFDINSYGFRGEALASISEVSKVTVMSKTKYAEIGTKLIKRGSENILKNVPLGFENGTIINVDDLFYNVPARQKFLKSSQTEFYYCYNYFVDVALRHYDKRFVLKKNDKMIFDLEAKNGLIERIVDIHKRDRSKNFLDISYQDENLSLRGIVGDSSLRFGSGENIKIYVNSRPIEDKVIRKALMDSYYRQISPGEYPFAILILDVKKSLVDVNVHPAKLNVKFWDSRKIYEIVYNTVKNTLSGNKIANVDIDIDIKKPILEKGLDLLQNKRDFNSIVGNNKENANNSELEIMQKTLLSPNELFNIQSQENALRGQENDNLFENEYIGEYKLVGQLWNSYIVLETKDLIYYIDQHALAERISFEKMKNTKNLTPELLLQPLKFNVSNVPNLSEKIVELNSLGFDISLLGENVIVVYSVPKVFVVYPIDMTKMLDYVLYLKKITYDHVLDGIYASKACKTSIKAGHKLSVNQMMNLVKEGFETIEGMFVCQHGRPFFVSIDKKNIDKLFDRA